MKYILLISLLIVNVKAITYNEIFGTWYISSLYDNKKVFFSGEFNKNITINFNENYKIDINGSTKYYFQLKSHDLLIGKWFKNGNIKATHDHYRFTSKVPDNLSYGMTCYILEPIRLGMGGIKTKHKMKICRDKRSILDKYRY